MISREQLKQLIEKGATIYATYLKNFIKTSKSI